MNTNLNLDPLEWGRDMWKSLHRITLIYPFNPSEIIKKNAYNFFTSLIYLLPCEKCRSNYKNHLLKYPLTDKILSTKTSLVYWLIDIHNEINRLLGKKILSHQEALIKITSFDDNKQNYIGNTKIIIILTILLLIIILLIILWYKKGHISR